MSLGTTDKLLKFRVGNFTNLKDTDFAPGTVYVTQDEKALYIDLPNGSSKETGRIRLGGMVQYASLQDWNAEVATQPPYNEDAIYYIVSDNALIKWNGTKWVQINSTATVTENLDALKGRVEILEAAKIEQATKITNLEKAVNTTIPATYATQDALKEATDDIVEIVEQIGDASDGLVKDIADNKKAIEDEVSARTEAINGINGVINEVKRDYLTTKTASETYQTIELAATKAELNTAKSDLLGTAQDTATTKTIEGAFKAVAAEAEARTNAINGINSTINGVKNDYLTKKSAEETYAKAADVATDVELNQAKADLLGTSGVAGNTIYGALKAVSDEALARTEAINGVNGAINEVKRDYLTTANASSTYQTIALAATKEELNSKAAELLGTENTAGNTIHGALKAVADEAARATSVENGLNTRLGKVETFFKTADGEELDTALDTLKEIQDYLNDEGSATGGIIDRIATAEQDIDTLESILGKKADGTEAATGLCKDVADNAAAIAQETANRNAALSWGTF